jgi:hypothetical protein
MKYQACTVARMPIIEGTNVGGPKRVLVESTWAGSRVQGLSNTIAVVELSK